MIKITKHQKFSDFCGLKISVEIFKLKEDTSRKIKEDASKETWFLGFR